MIYIKYTPKNDPTKWTIWAHTKDAKVETKIIDSNGETYPHQHILNLTSRRTYWKIKYLTQAEVDLIKLELL